MHHSCLLWVNDTLWFHLPIVDFYIMQFDNFFCYKDIGSKWFFTMATLLMPLLENGLFGNDIFYNGFLLNYIPFSRLVMLEVESSQTHLRKLILFPVFKIFLTQLSDKNLGIMDFLMEYLSNLDLVKGWVSKSRTFFFENLA